MKRAILVFALALAACNDNDLKNNSIPPIAGIVGGPDAPDGNGQVAMELSTGEATVDHAHPITITNETAGGEPVVVPVTGELTSALIAGDIGDELNVRWTHSSGSVEDTLFLVQPPRITRIGVAEGGEAEVIRLGANARIEGAGFCHTVLCTSIEVNGTPTDFPFFGEVRPGEIVFTVSTASGLVADGFYQISVRVADGAPAEQYVSNAYTVQVLAAE